MGSYEYHIIYLEKCKGFRTKWARQSGKKAKISMTEAGWRSRGSHTYLGLFALASRPQPME